MGAVKAKQELDIDQGGGLWSKMASTIIHVLNKVKCGGAEVAYVDTRNYTPYHEGSLKHEKFSFIQSTFIYFSGMHCGEALILNHTEIILGNKSTNTI